MKAYKKAAGGGSPTAWDKNERIYMNHITESPKAQGVIEYGHFRAEVKIYSSDDIRYKIDMIQPMQATKYDEYMDRTRWNEELSCELGVLMMRISSFEFDYYAGRIVHAV